MAGRATLQRRATYEDLLKVPDHLVAEILDGDLYTSPRPAIPHAEASSALLVELKGPFDRGRGGPGGWWILHEPELHLSEHVIVPDLAGWKRERLPTLPDAPAITLSPDWICEVVSPSTESIDRAVKLPVYARESVTHIWLVNPVARTLEVFRRDGAHWTLLATHTADARVRAEPFEAVELELASLWGRTPQ